MNLVSLYSELEEDLAWRQDEIRFHQNNIDRFVSDNEKDKARRACILFLYAHFEGFTKFALSLYIRAVNNERLTCNQISFALAAACLTDVFHALRDPQRKSDLFRRELPDDSSLHRIARDIEFFENTSKINNRIVEIPDKIIDPESNLTPSVLKKNLFRIGLPHGLFDGLKEVINRLLGYRNSIAHGEAKSGIRESDYLELRDMVFGAFSTIRDVIYNSLMEKDYIRKQEDVTH
jgi:hypothetical protein